MNKTIIFIISLLVFIFIILWTIYFWPSYQETAWQSGYIYPEPITGDLEIDNIIYQNLSTWWLLNHSLGSPSLINMVRVTNNIDGNIECKIGPAHDDLNLEKFYPDNLISIGRIRRCDLETVKLIDSIARDNINDCKILPRNPIPSDLNEYYLVTAGWNNQLLTEEKFNEILAINPCFNYLQRFINQEVPTIFFNWIIDRETGTIYR